MLTAGFYVSLRCLLARYSNLSLTSIKSNALYANSSLNSPIEYKACKCGSESLYGPAAKARSINCLNSSRRFLGMLIYVYTHYPRDWAICSRLYSSMYLSA